MPNSITITSAISRMSFLWSLMSFESAELLCSLRDGWVSRLYHIPDLRFLFASFFFARLMLMAR
jgi:hypothetical protein